MKLIDKLNNILIGNKLFNAAKIDGFLAATISSPNLIHLLQWVQITKTNDLDLNILFELYNKIYLGLRDGDYLPIFIGCKKNFLIDLCQWKEGYFLGRNLWDPSIVKIYEAEINQLLSKVMQFSKAPVKNRDYCMDRLSKACVDVYKFWATHYI